jgi:hypothetical protein
MNDTLVLIPSAKLVPVELQAEFGSISSAMVPVDSRPALQYLKEAYPDASCLVAANEGIEQIQQYVSRHLDDRGFAVVDVGRTGSLAETIIRALKSRTALPERLIINFADTTVGDVCPSGDFMLCAKSDDLFRWTTFTLDTDGRINAIKEKNVAKDRAKDWLTVVGVFGVSNPGCFLKRLMAAAEQHNHEVDAFYTALRIYFNEDCSSVDYIEVKEWYDFGHLDTYYESKKKLSMVCRHFNSIRIDSTRGILRKTSRNTDKFIDEIRWYLKLPAHLQYMAPRVFDYSTEYNDPYVELEYYGYPTLNDLYLYGSLDLGAWTRIFGALDNVLADMACYQMSASGQDIRTSLISMYETKTLKRMSQYKDLPGFSEFQNPGLKMGATELLTLDQVCELLPKVLEQSRVYGEEKLSIIHGDLCFSNILYDRRNGIIRTIDPRGSFGLFDLYGDPRYDQCKVSHSIMGDYDFLVNGLFDLVIEEGLVSLDVHLSEYQLKIKMLYADCVAAKYSVDQQRTIRLLESLLFLSMVPLHNDRPASQKAFLARGLELFSSIAGELE